LKGDRKDFEFVKTSLAAKGFDVIYDINAMQMSYDCIPFWHNILLYSSDADLPFSIYF
jgi:hypothetical protein